MVRFEGLPGEFSQHDFGHVDVGFTNGRTQRVHFFASRLKYSRYSVVTLVDDERVETIVRCLARDFVTFGGLPLMAVFDRPRTIVQKSGRGREVELFNASFAQAIIDIGVGVEMCAPRSGNQKGSETVNQCPGPGPSDRSVSFGLVVPNRKLAVLAFVWVVRDRPVGAVSDAAVGSIRRASRARCRGGHCT
jgi:hypothetical protein